MADRKPTFPVVISSPEDKEILDWLDNKLHDGALAARAAGTSRRGMNRSVMIFRILRGAMEAEREEPSLQAKPAPPPRRTPRKK